MGVPLHLCYNIQHNNYCDSYSTCVKIYLMHKINVQMADEHEFEGVLTLTIFLKNKNLFPCNYKHTLYKLLPQ
jgi:hypothetical protein